MRVSFSLFFLTQICSSTIIISNFVVAEIEGPEGTVYAKGVFEVKIQIPERCVTIK